MQACEGVGAKYNQFQSQWNIANEIVMLETKDEWRLIPHTLFMTKYNTCEGEMNERKFPKVSANSYAQIVFMAKEEKHLT